MPSTISFTLDLNLQSSNAHNIRPILPTIFPEHDIKRTITINKISSTKKKRLETKQNFLPLTPTIVQTISPINIDIQSKLGRKKYSYIFKKISSLLESVILKTVDCEIIDLFNQIVKRIK